MAPAYNLLSARLVISEKDDPEEMPLTLNCKKRKLKSGDFMHLADSLKLNQKQVDNIFKRFQKAMPTVLGFIDNPFLPEKKKVEYRKLIEVRAKRLWS